MAIKTSPSFQGGSFSRINTGSFSDQLRLKQNQKQFEQEMAFKQAALDAEAARQATLDARAKQEFDWKAEDRANAAKAANVYGAMEPVANIKESKITDIVTRSKEEQDAIKGVYQGESGNDLLGKNKRAQEIEKRLAELTPELANAPVKTMKEKEIDLGNSLVAPVARTGEGISGALDYIFSGKTLRQFDENGNPIDFKEAPDYKVDPNQKDLFADKQKAYDEKQKEFESLTKEYTQLDKDLRTQKGDETLARVGSTYAQDKTVKEQKRGVDVRKEYSSNIDAELERQNIPKKDRNKIKAILMDKVDPFVQEAIKQRATYDSQNADLKKTELENLAKVAQAKLKTEEANYKALSEANQKKVDSIDDELKFLRSERNRNDISDETRKTIEAKIANQEAQRVRILNTY